MELTNKEFWGLYDQIIQNEQIENYKKLEASALIISGVNNILGGKATTKDIIGELEIITLDDMMAEKMSELRPKTEFELRWIKWAEDNNIKYHYKGNKLIFEK